MKKRFPECNSVRPYHRNELRERHAARLDGVVPSAHQRPSYGVPDCLTPRFESALRSPTTPCATMPHSHLRPNSLHGSFGSRAAHVRWLAGYQIAMVSILPLPVAVASETDAKHGIRLTGNASTISRRQNAYDALRRKGIDAVTSRLALLINTKRIKNRIRRSFVMNLAHVPVYLLFKAEKRFNNVINTNAASSSHAHLMAKTQSDRISFP
jgi:hypothetical protein